MTGWAERIRRAVPGLEPTPRAAFLGLGSNVGDRLEHLRRALDLLEADADTTVEAVSAVYETEPWTGGDASANERLDEQGAYLNAVAYVTTTRTPRELLELAHEIEALRGRDRDREQRWGPRPLDIDVLLFEHETIDRPDLTVPHPRLRERAFVLVPLAEVLPPGATLPDGTRVSALLADLAPIEGIELHVRLTEGPGSQADPLTRRPPGPPGGPPRLGPAQGGEEFGGPREGQGRGTDLSGGGRRR